MNSFTAFVVSAGVLWEAGLGFGVGTIVLIYQIDEFTQAVQCCVPTW
jgi:hypothetical protein